MRKLSVLLLLMMLSGLAPAQSSKIVTAARANGTYRYQNNEIRILALGKNKLRVQLDLIYEYKSSYGPMANLGQATGEATIENDIAVFHPPDFPDCTITIKFLAGNKIKVTQDHDAGDCGFGNRVFADGTYTKIKAGKPKFESPL
ncbi:MAG TPA: hypothetical protein VMS31_10960 [Pyrinomonadaceae bacterium]|nr:hypothetical protein [Pyrinomonadaceae bacterium]